AALVFVLLPNDSPVWLAHRFNATRLGIYLHSSSTGDTWLNLPPAFPINITEDVGLIVKTGYGTQHRLPAALEALEMGLASQDIVAIADFTPIDEKLYRYNGKDVQLHDALGMMLEDESLNWMRSTPRFEKYLKMTTAIADGKLKVAEEICKSFGWEADAMKLIPGLKYALDLMPQKKWYILMDDDTYIIKPSMRLLLQHLDPDVPQYVGNPVGDYKARFAHGGSSIIFSRPVLQKLFVQSPKVVSAAYSASLTETWGDKLVATTLLKLGIYLDERYERLFNGESPLSTRIRPDRFCLPLVAFHSIKDPQRMREVGNTFTDVEEPVRWRDLWKIYQASGLGNMRARPIRKDEDHVGPIDESTATLTGVDEAEACLNACGKRSGCLAWAWDAKERSCCISPWMILGEQGSQGTYSGINTRRLEELMDGCQRNSRT
ncbi:MAG: hypothetical protein Q9160_009368, partial [Pyrenula sp. 1 TL-2023]